MDTLKVFLKLVLASVLFFTLNQDIYCQIEVKKNEPRITNNYSPFAELEVVNISGEDNGYYGELSQIGTGIFLDKDLNLGITMFLNGRKIGYGPLIGIALFGESGQKYDEFNIEHPVNWANDEVSYDYWSLSFLMTQRLFKFLKLYYAIGGAVQRKIQKYSYYDDIFIYDTYVIDQSKFGALFSGGCVLNVKEIYFSIGCNTFNFKEPQITLGIGCLINIASFRNEFVH